MTKTNDGGPAFPSDGKWGNGVPESGMSLRDYFAGLALPDAMHATTLDEDGCQRVAEMAYRVADAMLAEREKGRE